MESRTEETVSICVQLNGLLSKQVDKTIPSVKSDEIGIVMSVVLFFSHGVV